jgi:hypothetical protein
MIALINSFYLLLLLSSSVLASPAGTSKQCTPRNLKTQSDAEALLLAKTTHTSTKTMTTAPTATSSSSTIAKLKAAYSKSKRIDFSTITSTSQLSAQGLDMNTGWGIGSTAPDGGHCSGSVNNIAIRNGTLQLTVPGGQKKGGPTTGAELSFGSGLLGGVFEMVVELDATPGTCQSMVIQKANSVHKLKALSSSPITPKTVSTMSRILRCLGAPCSLQELMGPLRESSSQITTYVNVRAKSYVITDTSVGCR